jgi:hypothetical protein
MYIVRLIRLIENEASIYCHKVCVLIKLLRKISGPKNEEVMG